MALTVTIAQLTDSRSVVMEQKEQVEKQCRKCATAMHSHVTLLNQCKLIALAPLLVHRTAAEPTEAHR